MLIFKVVLAALAIPGFAAQIQPPSPQTQPPQAQTQACLAALPPAPKPPRPATNLFPGLQQKMDEMIRKAGGDPNAMRAAASQAAQQKYADAKAEYERQRAACSAPAVVPVNPFITPVPAPAPGAAAPSPAPLPQPK
jgi:hypothetical protein